MTLKLPEPPLQDDEILLRPIREDDVAAITVACQDREISRWTAIPWPYDDEVARAWIGQAAEAWNEGQGASFAMIERTTGRFAGSIGLRLREPGIGDVGYWAAKNARGRGYTTRALALVARWALDDLRLARVQLMTIPGNVASERVAEKVGFQREGRLRSAFNQRGQFRDIDMWSLLPSDLRS